MDKKRQGDCSSSTAHTPMHTPPTRLQKKNISPAARSGGNALPARRALPATYQQQRLLCGAAACFFAFAGALACRCCCCAGGHSCRMLRCRLPAAALPTMLPPILVENSAVPYLISGQRGAGGSILLYHMFILFGSLLLLCAAAAAAVHLLRYLSLLRAGGGGSGSAGRSVRGVKQVCVLASLARCTLQRGRTHCTAWRAWRTRLACRNASAVLPSPAPGIWFRAHHLFILCTGDVLCQRRYGFGCKRFCAGLPLVPYRATPLRGAQAAARLSCLCRRYLRSE